MKGLASWRSPRKPPALLTRTPRPYSARLARFSTTPKRNVGLVELPTKLAADWTSATSSIGDAFLALPSQTGLSYTASLVAATLAIRLVVHLPVALWARSRTLRYQTSVLPALQMFMARLSRQRASKAEVMAWSTEKRATYGRLMTGKIEAEEKRLARHFHCYRPYTIFGSVAIPIPILILMSASLRSACAASTPSTALGSYMPAADAAAEESLPHLFAEHSLFSDTSIVLEDPALALAFGASLMLASEVSWTLRRWAQAAHRTSPPAGPEPARQDKPAPRGVDFEKLLTSRNPLQVLLTPERIRTFSGAMAVTFAGISMFQPALVVLYWTTNTLCAVVQNVVFNRRDRIRLGQMRAASSARDVTPAAGSARKK